MLHVAYDITSLAESPRGGIAQVCYHTIRQAARHDGITPVACYRSGNPENLAAPGVATRRIYPLSGLCGAKYDIAHSLCHRTLKVRARKNVYHVHDIWSLRSNPYQSPAFQRKLGQRMRGDILRADFVLTISETTRQNLLALDLIAPERTRAIHLGFDPEPENADRAVDPAVTVLKDEPYVLFVGCLEVRKNLGHVVDAVRPLDKIHLVLAGAPGFGYTDRIRPQLGSFPEHRLHHFSRLDRLDLKVLYENAAVLLLPSWEEGFGLPIIEAMANGCPVITSSRSANAEVAGDGAILVDPENPIESRYAIERLIDDDSYRAAMIESGKRRSKMFTWQNYFGGLVEVYERLLAS